MRFYKQLTYWRNTLKNSAKHSPIGMDEEDEERKLKKMRVMGEEMEVVRMLLGKRIEAICGDFVLIDLNALFSFYNKN